MDKRLALIVLAVAISVIFAIGLGLISIWTVPSSMTLRELAAEGLLYNSYYLDREPVLMFNTTSKSGWPQTLYVRDEVKIKRFLDLAKNKRAVRLSDAEYEKIQPLERRALNMMFDPKFSYLTVLDDGRITFSVPTPHYRNKSRLYWLRWKIDGFGTRYVGVTYITEPDPVVIKEAGGLFRVAKPAQ